MRHRRGEKFTYSVLVSLIVDPYIEITLSSLALVALVLDFGPESLLLDDRIHESLFVGKEKGKNRDISLVDILCESLASSDDEDVTDAVVLLAIFSNLDAERRRQFTKIIARHANKSEHVFNLNLFVRGEITLQELEARLTNKF